MNRQHPAGIQNMTVAECKKHDAAGVSKLLNMRLEMWD